MKKMINLLIILFCVITLSGCGKSETIYTQRTIILNVDTDVVPTFSSNFGTGNYDELTKTYTHTIDYIKDLYIFLNYDDLKTVTVYVPTSDMNLETITKDIEFGQNLDAEVEITVEGVKELEGLQLSNTLTYSNLSVGKKNTFKFTLPSREQGYNIRFTLPNYREFNIDLAKKDLVSGSAKINTVAITNEQMYIGFTGNDYSYEIYSLTSNDLITTGRKWEDDNKIEYVLLSNNDSYYVKTNDSNYQTRLHKINQGEDAIIDLGKRVDASGYLYINEGSDLYNSIMMYYKNNKTLTNSTEIRDSLEKVGLLVENYENKWFYMENLEGKITRDDNGNYGYTLDYNDFVEVSFDVTRINAITNETVSSEIENNITLYSNAKAEFDNNVFTLTISEIETGRLTIDLYNKDNEKIDTFAHYIYPYFKGDIMSGTITYNNRTIPYQFPVFLEDLVYDGGNYSYPDQIINVNVSYVQFKFVDEYGNIGNLYESDNPYVIDEELNVIMYTETGNNLYFELLVNKEYTLHYNNRTYSFTTTQSNIESGIIYIIDENTPLVNVRIPHGYKLELDNFTGYDFIPDEEGIIEIPLRKNSWYYGTLSNGFASININIKPDEIIDIYEFEPFYVLNGGKIRYDGNTYDISSSLGDNGLEYVYIKKRSEITSPVDNLRTNITKVNSYNNEEEYTISKNKFVYNDEIKAYYYDLESEFDHVITFKDSLSRNGSEWSQYYYYYYDYDLQCYKGYVDNNTTIEYEYYDEEWQTISYIITSNDAKYIDIKIDTSSNSYEFIVSETN